MCNESCYNNIDDVEWKLCCVSESSVYNNIGSVVWKLFSHLVGLWKK